MAEERGVAFEQGPYVQVAAFCETVVEGKDGTLTLVRMVDQFTRTEASPDAPREMPPSPITLRVVIGLKSGRARGSYELHIVPEKPSGETLPHIIFPVRLEGEHRGHNIIANIGFTFDMEGLYWFRVYLEDKLLTAMPLRVIYQRVLTGPTRPR
jgi:hypothetical protein